MKRGNTQSARDDQARYVSMRKVASSHNLRLRVKTNLGTATADPARALALCRELSLELTLDASHYIVQGLSFEQYSPLFPYVGAVQVRACAPQQMQLHAEQFNRALLIPAGFSGDITVEYIDRDIQWDETLSSLCASLKTG